MDSNLQHPHHSIHLLNDRSQQQKPPMASGLTRYQSAPSSYFSSFLDRDLCDELLNRPSSPETERIFARFLANSESFLEPKQDPAVAEAEQVFQLQQQQQQQGFYPSQSRPQPPPPLPPPRPPPAFLDQNPGQRIDYVGPQLKVGVGSSLSGGNLVRHSSSPAGFLANINIGTENGYPVMRGMGDFGAVTRDASYSAASRPPPTTSSSGRMSPIAEIGSKNMGENSGEHLGGFGVANRGNHVTSFPSGSWDDIAEDDKSFLGLNESENQGGEAGTAPRMLSHHLSLHKTSAEMAALEKILHFQDSVPCKTRAKRGFATHPRSIAERVRRTKISERMRKLQDLVPNMDKQTNTADMLDLAVDYIKDLQGQVKGLQESRAKCICSKDIHQQ